MEDLTAVGRSLPIFALLPALGVSFVLMLAGVRNLRSPTACFVVWAIYLRFVMGALHDLTFKASPLGLSYNALFSVAIVLIGLFVVRRRGLFDAAIVPFVPLTLVIIVSGLMNGQVPGFVTAMTKYAYLLILILAIVDAFKDVGPDRMFRAMLWPFALPAGLQLISIVLNIPKPGETDGADSFIGGFHHEAAFSTMLIAAILVVCLARNIRLSWKIGMIVYGFAAIVLANYRTAIVSVLPLVAVTLLTAVPRRFVAGQRALVIGAMAIVAVGTFAAGSFVAADRFADLGTVSQAQGDTIKRPEMFSTEDQRVMSGRTYIWSMYFYGWFDAPTKQKLIGYGSESWSLSFPVYAHNTLVSALYETGVFGAFATLLLWSWMVGLALLARGGPRLDLVAAHLSFLVLNMATMPMWLIEGMIFYGILCGYTVYWFGRSRSMNATPAPAAHSDRSLADGVA